MPNSSESVLAVTVFLFSASNAMTPYVQYAAYTGSFSIMKDQNVDSVESTTVHLSTVEYESKLMETIQLDIDIQCNWFYTVCVMIFW